MKKSLLIISIVIAIIITGITTVQAATTTAELKTSSTSVKQGDTFKVTLSATCDGGIALVSGNEADDGFAFSYDSSKLELVSKEAKRLIDLNEEATSGTICLMGSSTSFSTGDIYEFTFKVKSNATDGDTQVSVTPVKITNFDDVETTVTVKSATITIANSSSTPAEPSTPDKPSNPDSPSNPTTPTDPTSGSTNNGGSSSTSGTSKSGSTTSNTAGKTTDSTTSTTALPKTGSIAIMGGTSVILIAVSIFTFKKLRQYKEIK